MRRRWGNRVNEGLNFALRLRFDEPQNLSPERGPAPRWRDPRRVKDGRFGHAQPQPDARCGTIGPPIQSHPAIVVPAKTGKNGG